MHAAEGWSLFKLNIGRRHNADPRWLLPLICRRGGITKNEVGAIRIQANETGFQIPKAIAARFAAAVIKSAGQDGEDDSGIRIEQVQGGGNAANDQRGPAPRRQGPPPMRHKPTHAHRKGPPSGGAPRRP